MDEYRLKLISMVNNSIVNKYLGNHHTISEEKYKGVLYYYLDDMCDECQNLDLLMYEEWLYMKK